MTEPSRESILIVDDQEENLRIVEGVLSMMDYEVILAKSCQQALERLETRIPDLILLDVMMPEVDGLATCRIIKSDPRWVDTPVIFLSAADDKNLIVEALETGGVDYVTKPFNMAELVSRVRTQMTLKKASDQLRALAEDKDEILGILAHDVKNSLAGMRISAGLLRSYGEHMPDRCVPLVDNILSATDRMLNFMKEFLANQHAEHLQMKKQRVNLRQMVESLGNMHLPAAEAKQLSLSISLPEREVMVEADKEGVSQILDNLLSNAIKFTPSGGKVAVTLESPSAGAARLLVKDNGPGFTPEDRAKMFRRYGKLSAQPTAGEPSTGLGLSIVKRLAEAMSGSISLSQKTNHGAEFTVILPIHNGDATTDAS